MAAYLRGAHHPPHHCAVLLLDMGLIILAIGARAGECDLCGFAPVPDRGEPAINRRCADLEQTQAHRLVQRKMAMPLHRRDQQWEEWLQPLSADPITRFPEHDQRLAHRVVVNAAFRPDAQPRTSRAIAHHRANAMITMPDNGFEPASTTSETGSEQTPSKLSDHGAG